MEVDLLIMGNTSNKTVAYRFSRLRHQGEQMGDREAVSVLCLICHSQPKLQACLIDVCSELHSSEIYIDISQAVLRCCTMIWDTATPTGTTYCDKACLLSCSRRFFTSEHNASTGSRLSLTSKNGGCPVV